MQNGAKCECPVRGLVALADAARTQQAGTTEEMNNLLAAYAEAINRIQELIDAGKVCQPCPSLSKYLR